MAKVISRLKLLSPLSLPVMVWDIFFPSRISHCAWWCVFPFIACAWIAGSKHRMSKAAVAIVLVGALMNGIAVMSNAGMMPVDRPERVRKPNGDKSHIAMTSLTRCRYLSDIIYTGWAVMSVGDLIQLVGYPFWIVGFVLQKRRCS